MSVCVSVCVSVYMITQKNNGLIHFKIEHIIVYMNIAQMISTLGIVRSRSQRKFEMFLHLPQYKLSSPKSQL